MRKIVVLAALLLALPAAKPAPPEDAAGGDAPLASQAWRDRAVPICIARLRAIRDFTPDDLETICGCTFDTYLEGHGANPLPGLESGRVPVAVDAQLLSCTARVRPDQRSAVLRLGATWPVAAPPMPTAPTAGDDKPAADADVGPLPETGRAGDGGGFLDWIRSISLPAWLTGADMLLWVALGIFVFGLLILKLRARDPRNDLLGPPSSMRRGAPPQPPRRPDLPR